jgi:hypothetical protein
MSCPPILTVSVGLLIVLRSDETLAWVQHAELVLDVVEKSIDRLQLLVDALTLDG